MKKKKKKTVTNDNGLCPVIMVSVLVLTAHPVALCWPDVISQLGQCQF